MVIRKFQTEMCGISLGSIREKDIGVGFGRYFPFALHVHAEDVQEATRGGEVCDAVHDVQYGVCGHYGHDGPTRREGAGMVGCASEEGGDWRELRQKG